MTGHKNYVCKEGGGPRKKYVCKEWVLRDISILKIEAKIVNMYVRKGGPTRNYKIRKGGPRRKYVCKEGGGVKTFSCHPFPPGVLFF